MTKREMYELIATTNADNAEIVDFCHHEIELLDNRKNGNRKPTKNQLANAEIKERILTLLTDKGVQCKDIAEALGVSGQKCSALLKQLVESGKVEKYAEKRVTYFKAVTE